MRRRLALVALLAAIFQLMPFAVAEAAPVIPPTVVDEVQGLPEQLGAAAVGGGHTSEPIETRIPFSVVGFEAPAGTHVEFRTSVDGVTWDAWDEAHADAGTDEGPDLTSPEARSERRALGGHVASEPAWVGEARYLQVRVDGARPRDVTAHLIDATGLSRSLAGRVADQVKAAFTLRPATARAADRPDIIYRHEWGADESISDAPSYGSVTFAAVHHTVTGNDYSEAQAPAALRSIQRYHSVTKGWKDIGYNFLIDRFGNIYEGRKGGVDRAVRGAHAAGFNHASFGVSMLGTYTSLAPSRAMVESLAQLITWKFETHGVDPSRRVSVTSQGSNKWPSGTRIGLDAIVGHRDLGQTSCPGEGVYRVLPSVRRAVIERVDPSAFPAPAPTPEPTTAPEPEPIVEPEPEPEPVEEPPPPPAPDFHDTVGSTHEEAIELVAGLGITAGCGHHVFCPESPVTRGQMATFLVRARQDLEPVPGSRFRDVPADHVHASAINAVVEAGLADGYPDGTFRPDQALTRAQMAVFLREVLKLELVWGTKFIDIPAWENFVRPRVNAIAAAGITTGCDPRKYCPVDQVSRAQMASFIVRALEQGL